MNKALRIALIIAGILLVMGGIVYAVRWMKERGTVNRDRVTKVLATASVPQLRQWMVEVYGTSLFDAGKMNREKLIERLSQVDAREVLDAILFPQNQA